MKIAIIGAAGLRTPIILQSILARQDQLQLHDLSLMDIDDDHLELIRGLTRLVEKSSERKFELTYTTDAESALKNADFVITTFRVGGIESRAIDERIPLQYGILGQETTGPGGFAMGMRSIPVILDYVQQMNELCPDAWLVNFANPAGMLTEAVIRHTGWKRVVGICDAPESMRLVIAAFLGINPENIHLDYFGLNHLGWIRRILHQSHDYLGDILDLGKSTRKLPGLPFDIELILDLQLIPNEYLFYYYHSKQAVENILSAGVSRGEQIAILNTRLFSDLRQKFDLGDFDGMLSAYHSYIHQRGDTYMFAETGKSHDLSMIDPNILKSLEVEGYAGVALNLIEALIGGKSTVQYLNIANRGAILGMDELDVVEIPALVSHDNIQPLAVGTIPDYCFGLIKQVKSYEHLAIEAAHENSYQKALLALTIHPLVGDFYKAKLILNDYIKQHASFFPKLN